MPPQSFSLRLQHGIRGGFAPPTPNAIHDLNFEVPDASALAGDNHPVIKIRSATRDDGTSQLGDPLDKALAVPAGSDEERAIHELHDIITEQLPIENPPGSEDIYDEDTSIAFQRGDFFWANGGPQGCGSGESAVKADEEHKQKFKRAVAIINNFVKKAQ